VTKIVSGGGRRRPPRGPSGPPRGPRDPRDPALEEAKKKILLEAQEKAREIVATAEEHVQKGYDQGYQDGIQQAQSEWVERLFQLNEAHEKVLRHLEPQLVELAIEIATKMIGRKLEVEPDIIVDIVANALEGVRHQREIFIRVNPDDYPAVEQHKPALLERLSRAQDLDIRSDEDIQRGGCKIESGIGTIDASLEKQLETIEKILLGS
jgi:type III secretion protein L